MTEPLSPLGRSFGLSVQPMVHVAEMPAAVSFYESLGGRLIYGSRDGDWALMGFGGTFVSLLARPPGDGDLSRVELQFMSTAPLEAIEAHLNAVAPSAIDRGVADEAFGRMLKLTTPDGLLIKILELERDLIE